MVYSIIDVAKGRSHGMTESTHRLLSAGSKMIVNENELRVIGDDIARTATELGGELLSYGELLNKIKNLEK